MHIMSLVNSYKRRRGNQSYTWAAYYRLLLMYIQQPPKSWILACVTTARCTETNNYQLKLKINDISLELCVINIPHVTKLGLGPNFSWPSTCSIFIIHTNIHVHVRDTLQNAQGTLNSSRYGQLHIIDNSTIHSSNKHVWYILWHGTYSH